MTLFFLILLTVSLSIYALQRLRIRKKPTIKPSLPKTQEKPSEPPPLLTTDSKPELISGQEKQQEPKPPANLPV
jgi:hypothetical protein